MKRYIGIFLSISCVSLLAMDDPNPNPTQNIWDLVFLAHKAALSTNQLKIKQLDTATDEDSQELARIESQRICLSKQNLFERVKNLLKAESKHKMQKIVPINTIQKLEILAGKSDLQNPGSVKHCVLLQFPTLTTSGRALLAKRLVTFREVSKIKAFQERIESFRKDSEGVSILRAKLKTISRSEQVLVSLSSDEEATYDLVKSYITKRIPNFFNGAKSIGIVNAPSDDFKQQKLLIRTYGRFVEIFIKENARSDAFVKTLRTLLKYKTQKIFAFHQAVELITKYLTTKGTGSSQNPAPKIKEQLECFLNSDNTKQLIGMRDQLYNSNDSIERLGLYFQLSIHLNLMKKDLLSAYKTIGKLDRILSIVHVMNNSKNPFCLATFTQTEDVTLKLDNYWNLLLGDQAIANSITITPKDPHKIIVAGINATGKTTAIKAIGLCEYLASTLGVVPASVYKVSKPAQVLISINEKDRLASKDMDGVSLHQAQAIALSKLIKRAKKNPQQRKILIVDEPFSGTRENISQKGIITFFEHLPPKTICLLTTHGKGVTEFAKNNPKIYRLLYSHQGFIVDNNKKNALDYSSIEKEIAALFSDSDSDN